MIEKDIIFFAYTSKLHIYRNTANISLFSKLRSKFYQIYLFLSLLILSALIKHFCLDYRIILVQDHPSRLRNFYCFSRFHLLFEEFRSSGEKTKNAAPKLVAAMDGINSPLKLI